VWGEGGLGGYLIGYIWFVGGKRRGGKVGGEREGREVKVVGSREVGDRKGGEREGKGDN